MKIRARQLRGSRALETQPSCDEKIASYILCMNTSLASLSNTALLDQLKRLAQREREATATLVAHLAEVKKRKLYLGEGYGSMFQYCTQVLHLSEHATYLRLEAAKMALRFPATLVALENGDLNFSYAGFRAPMFPRSFASCR